MIYMPPSKNAFKLKMNDTSLHIDQSIVNSRDIYTLRALILFLLFRKREDLSKNGRTHLLGKLLNPKKQFYPKAS